MDRESKGNYSEDEEIKFLTSSIESSLCNYSGAYILVTGDIRATIEHHSKNAEQK